MWTGLTALAGLWAVRFVILRLTDSISVEAVTRVLVLLGVLLVGYATFASAKDYDRRNPRDASRRDSETKDDIHKT